jgi:hypothetical protein
VYGNEAIMQIMASVIFTAVTVWLALDGFSVPRTAFMS